MRNNTISTAPITFSVDEAREIITKMMGMINEFNEIKKRENKQISLSDKIRKNKRFLLKSIRNYLNRKLSEK